MLSKSDGLPASLIREGADLSYLACGEGIDGPRLTTTARQLLASYSP
jgi:hypothetical protein